ncbi:O-antigen ligase family protein [Robiginitalea sp. IMCC43444]|uniref:O-antigen ligase family protein n=1 Tax=Robiginitalea sp. IMCC43444 TaxID=3459121 RepID=UPI004041F861
MKFNLNYYGFVSLLLVFLYYCHGDAYLIIWVGIPSVIFFPLIALLIAPVLTKKNSLAQLSRNQLLLFFLVFTGLMLLWVGLASLPATEMENNYAFVKKQLLNLAILLVCLVWLTSEKAVIRVRHFLFWGLILGIVLNLYDATHIGSYDLMNDPVARSTFSMIYARAAGFYLDPNVSAITLTFGLILTEKTIENKTCNLIYVLTAGLAVLLTLSISGALAFGIFIYRKYFLGRLKLGSVLTILMAFVILSFSIKELMQRKIIEFGPGITQRIMAVVDPFSTEDELVTKNSRAILLKNAVNKFWDHPILGNGIGQHQFIETEQAADTRAGTHAGPHNQWLAFLIDFGLLGLLLYASLFLLLLPKVNSMYREEVMTFLVVYFVYSLFSHTALINHSLMLLLPLVYRLGRIVKTEEAYG